LPEVISEKTLRHCVPSAAGVRIRGNSEPLCAHTFGNQYKHRARLVFYTSGWNKFEPLWNPAIQMRQLNGVTRLLEAVIAKVSRQKTLSNNDILDLCTQAEYE
jgi:hypothetical protein